MGLIYAVRNYIQKWKYRDVRLGRNSRIGLGTVISNPSNMSVGENSYINGGVFSIGNDSKISIGNDCLISYNVHLRTTSHNYEDKNALIRMQGKYEKNIVVEDDVWIGYGAQILPGVTLHKGCVVGAGAVVTKDVPPNEVWGGYRQV